MRRGLHDVSAMPGEPAEETKPENCENLRDNETVPAKRNTTGRRPLRKWANSRETSREREEVQRAGNRSGSSISSYSP